MPTEDSTPKAIDLFCGAGGMSLGFEQAGVRVVAAYDIEAFNVATHMVNFPNSRTFQTDISKATGKALLRDANAKRGEIDVVFGGPPCQGFSIGGRRDAHDSRNQLIFEFIRIVNEIRPKYFVMENVRGLLSSYSNASMSKFIELAQAAKYELAEPIQALNARDFGVPQRRLRTFILGFRMGVVPPKYPTAPATSAGLTVVRDAISDLPEIERFPYLRDEDSYLGTLGDPTSDYARFLRGIERDPWDKAEPRPWPRCLPGCQQTLHSDQVTKRFRSTKPGGVEPISRYIRLNWDDVSPTIRAGTGKDHGSHTAPRPIHPQSPRCITVREAARLHSFPDWFNLHGTRWHAFRQIGNSVPPLLARAVASEVRKAIVA